MRSMHLAAAALVVLSGAAAFAEDSVPPEATAAIASALAEIGCVPGEIKTEDAGFEVNSAECKDGEYEIKLDKNYNITDQKKD
jgi:hypothetical protein